MVTFSDNDQLSEVLPLATGTTPGRIYRGLKAIKEFALFIYIKYLYKKKILNHALYCLIWTVSVGKNKMGSKSTLKKFCKKIYGYRPRKN